MKKNILKVLGLVGGIASILGAVTVWLCKRND